MRIQLSPIWKYMLLGLTILSWLNACSTSISTPLTSPTVGQVGPTTTTTSAKPTSQSFATTTPTALLQETPVAPTPIMIPASATLSAAPIGALQLKGQSANWVSLDESYLYWTVREDPRHIFRYPLVGGQVETIAISRFADGDLTTYQPIRSGSWLIFLDTHQRNNTAWLIRALNLKDRTEQIVLEELGDPTSWPGPDFDADEDWVVWTRTGHNKSKNCDETILAVYNLKSGKKRELERICAEHEHLWAFPHISGHHIVVEQDLPDEKGKGNDTYLFDLTTGQHTALTTNHESSMPTIAGQWIVWKGLPRFEWDRIDVVYDMQSGSKKTITVPAREAAYHRQSGQWLYWRPSSSFYAYNLTTNQEFVIVPEGNGGFVCAGAIYGNIVAWCLDTEPAKAPPKDTVLQWRTLP